MTDFTTMSNRDFVDFLFDKMTDLDTDLIDLHGDDTCCDQLEFERLFEPAHCPTDTTTETKP